MDPTLSAADVVHPPYDIRLLRCPLGPLLLLLLLLLYPPPPLLTPFVAVVPPLAAAAVVRPRHAADAVPIPAADVARYDYPTVSGW